MTERVRRTGRRARALWRRLRAVPAKAAALRPATARAGADGAADTGRGAVGRLRRPAAARPARAGARAATAARRPPAGGPRPDGRGPLAIAIERGTALDEAVLQDVRDLLADGRARRPHAIAGSLRRHAATEELGRLAAGVTAFHQGHPILAWSHLRGLPPAVWGRLAPDEHLRSGLLAAPEEALAAVRELVAADPPGVPPRSWHELAGALFGHGDQEAARAVFAVLERRLDADPAAWPEGARHRDWLAPWIAADPGSATAPPPPGGRPVIAVMDYAHPGIRRASANIGDHVQSIASLGHLVRHRGVRLHGPPELVGLLERLRSRVRPEAARDDLQADVEVMTVHRDASMYQAIPEGTWVLCFGWYMHALFALRHGFPLHRNLRPVFVSFHCNKRDLLTPDAIAYLKRHGPVGCRDWTTTHLLASAGVPAFFSGCLTTTTNTVFPDVAPPRPGAPKAYVDVPDADVPPGGVRYAHSSPKVRARSFIANTELALDRLDTYRREHPEVVTSRLHCHLPLRSMGHPTVFRPANPADVRFDGLIGITDAAFDAIRDGITDKLDRVLRRIAAGAGEDEVYGLWRELTADDVAAAEAERRRPAPVPPVPAKLTRRAEVAVAGAVSTRPRTPAGTGDPIHIAVVREPTAHAVRSLPVLLDSLAEHATRPLHVHVLADAPADGRLEAEFPELTVTWIAGGLLKRRGRTLARLALPDLVPAAERLVVLPLPAAATADVAELAGLELGPHALAAPDSTGLGRHSGFGVVNGAANRLRGRPQAAAELRRAALARHAFDFDAFLGSVLVLDLARLRRERTFDEALALAAAYDLTDVEALHLVLGPDRARVPERWAASPVRTAVDAPGLRHWTDGLRPWDALVTPDAALWQRHATMR